MRKVSFIILLVGLAFLHLKCSSGSKSNCYNLRCADLINPSGVTDRPYFGWYINDPDDGEIQTAYQILVASSPDLLNETDADFWNSGKVNSDKQNHIYYTGERLTPATRYYWAVRSWDKDDNESDFSEVARFDVGLVKNDDWKGAKWIRREDTTNENYTYFRKHFTTENQVERAMVYVSAAHDFELYLNSELIGKGPGYHYPQYQYYKTFDITKYIQEASEYVFASRTHWYGQGQGRPKSDNGFILKAIIEYADGNKKVITTDESWKQTQVASILSGQKQRQPGEGVGYVDQIDSRLFINNWNQVDFNDAQWEAAEVIGNHPVDPWVGEMQPNLARLFEEEISPVSINKISNDTYVIDFGKVYAGTPKIQFAGDESGEEVNMMGGYTLMEDGSVDISTNQRTDLSYNFILNGSQATFKPMVYMGMRYLQVTGSPNELTQENVNFTSRYFEVDDTRSSFESSDEMLNKVWRLMKHSLKVGTQESFVDTPTREKGGFLGDSWSIGVSSMAAMGERVMNLRVLEEFLDSQDQFWEDGRLNAVYPNGDGARDIPDYTQMFLVWAWDYYLMTGNRQFLIDNFDKIEKVAQYVESHIDPVTGLVKNLSGGGGPYLYGIIDWPATMRYGYDMSTTIRTVINAYAYTDFLIISKIAKEIGKQEVSEEYHSKSEAIKSSMNELLVNDRGLYVDGLLNENEKSSHISQHANAFPLAMGIAPEENVDDIMADIKDKKMSMGMVALRWLPEAIGKAGDGPHLLDLYTRKDWDGWSKIISKGATMTWESWDALETDQSLSHPWGAVGVLGIQQYILGVKILKPQAAKIQIRPLNFGGRLGFAKGVVPSDRGDIAVEWRRDGESFFMTVQIPDNVTADVYLPAVDPESVNSIAINGEPGSGKLMGDHFFIGTFKSGNHQFKL